MFPPALAIQQANDAVPGTVPKIAGPNLYLQSDSAGKGAIWTSAVAGGTAPTLFYADQTARRAVTLTVGMLYSVARQASDGSLWIVIPPLSGTTPVWGPLCAGPESIGPTGTDYSALAAANGLTVIGYYRADYAPSITGTSGTGKASWANLAGAMSAITPDGTATNGIGSVTAGLNGRAGLIQNGATQMGTYTAPALAAPGTTNWHRYFIVRQASGGPGGTRNILSETGAAYQVQAATGTTIYAFGAATGGQVWTQDVWLRMRASYTGSTTSEWKAGNQTLATGTGSGNTVPVTTRQFGSLLLTGEWLMYMELTGPLANFHTFATAADAAAQTDWTSAVQI